MTVEERYEIKFVVEEIRINDLLSWACQKTPLTSKYPARCVNSLYFDDDSFESATDNLSGISRRRKYRLRWYGEPGEAPAAPPIIEIKNRHAGLGYKNRVPIVNLNQRLLTDSVGQIGTTVNQTLQTEIFAKRTGSAADLRPVVHVNYYREYYEDFMNFRMTIDRNVNFRRAIPHRCIFDSMPHIYAPIIVELKFPAAARNYVSGMMNTLHLVPQRHSKYLAGLANLGLLQYI